VQRIDPAEAAELRAMLAEAPWDEAGS